MTHAERLLYLIKYLINENSNLKTFNIPIEETAKKQLLRSLMNIRPPRPIGTEFLKIQDEYLKEEVREKGITDSTVLPISPVNHRLVLWQGDITTLKIDAIVNAANSASYPAIPAWIISFTASAVSNCVWLVMS